MSIVRRGWRGELRLVILALAVRDEILGVLVLRINFVQFVMSFG